MSKTISSKSTRTVDIVISQYGRKTIKNTFAPNCRNEYFTHATVFALCKHGFPIEKLPEKAKQMYREYKDEYIKRCIEPGDPPIKVHDPPDDIEFVA